MPDARWDGLLIDIEGVLHVGSEPIRGAPQALELLRSRQMPFRLVTNTTSRSRRLVVERLKRLGFAIEEPDVLTPAALAVNRCRDRGYDRVGLHVAAALAEDLNELGGVSDGEVDAVVVGDLGDEFTPARLNTIFAQLQGGAELIALQRNRVWQSEDGLVLDAGPYIAALEYATGQTAVVTGKPSAVFFAAALDELGVAAHATAMIGDDIEADVAGAQDAGLDGILVRTGKFRQYTFDTAGIRPTEVWASIEEIGEHL